jgi:hypothetical protein
MMMMMIKFLQTRPKNFEKYGVPKEIRTLIEGIKINKNLYGKNIATSYC